MYDRNILGSPSVVFGNLRKSSENLRKCSETFVWPSEESGRKSSENRHILYNKKKITWLRGDTKFILSCRKIFQHSTINFFSPRGHVISSISLPSPPSEIQLKNKTETGDGSGYTLELTDTLIHWIISMQRKLTFFPHYNSGRNHWILNSIDINRAHKVLLLFSQG